MESATNARWVRRQESSSLVKGEKGHLIVNLRGGLGNQMFQYACGRAASSELGVNLKFAVDMLGQARTPRVRELDRVFGLKPAVASATDLRQMLGSFRSSPWLRRLLARPQFLHLRGRRFVVEPQIQWWGQLYQTIGSGAYLHGYWQSERYFGRWGDVIRSDFSFKEKLKDRNAAIAELISKGKAISIHVRRGDYLSNAATLKTHGSLVPDYYLRAIASLRRRLTDSRLFAFSDDPLWVLEKLKPHYPEIEVISHNRADESFNDMHLMLLCDHHIIANSTFSWWGAWLNPKPSKIVIAPVKWFADDRDSSDLIPPQWERI